MKFTALPLMKGEILWPSARHLKQRLETQSGRLTVSQAVTQPTRQADRHSLACFGGSPQLQAVGNNQCALSLIGRVVVHSPDNPPGAGLNPGQRPLAPIDQLTSFFTRPWFKSFKAQTFDTHPTPPP